MRSDLVEAHDNACVVRGEPTQADAENPENEVFHRRRTMPRLDFIAESDKSPAARALIEMAQQRGAPDWRVASIMARNPTAGLGWVEY